MEDFERVQIEALLGARQETAAGDLELGQEVYRRAFNVLERCPDTPDTQIIWGSDDDRMVKTKVKKILYKSENMQQVVALTNFHRNELGEAIAVEIPDEKGYLDSIEPDYLFAVKQNGEINSPLGLVRPELAAAILELFEEVPVDGSVSAA